MYSLIRLSLVGLLQSMYGLTPGSGGSSSGNFTTVTASTFVSTPSLITAIGALTITPAAGSNLNIALSTTGDFAVNTSQLYVDTSSGNVGIGIISTPARLTVDTNVAAATAGVNVLNSTGGATNTTGITFGGSGVYGFIDYDPLSTNGVRISALGPLRLGINTNDVYGSSTFTEAMRVSTGGNIGIGTGATVSAKLHVVSTTEQLRLGYDASDYCSVTVGATGSTTFALTGTSPVFTFSQRADFSASIRTASAVTWDLGAAAVVSPTSPNRTLAVTVAGTTYYIAAKTTND